MYLQYRKACRSIMKNCRWNDMNFDCCDKFLPLETEYGVCFSINSLHTIKIPGSEINMKSNRKTGPGQLYIETVDDVRMYFHAPEDVPFINSNSDQRKDIALGEIYNITINVSTFP
ncbi:hypothetical protein ILUMI_24600 [Ignelater luminosus]|uniref:Uncharacterized protein n=1 Tax=Ignelater luminosus TaxID=2038154 RepID=A0A8K0FWI8_IGNLU|nr:hypothetical protein ILUMI_24600 [Ignelater luminosus]